ncbi:MAG: cupin domain-containing protein [Candidatus Latescibacteria bacterium]|nr:cupin domain-containing protein [Candidatus Latescibacterota bacterium]
MNMEEMYIVFDGPARFTVNGETSELPAGSMVLCPRGSSHGIFNRGDAPIRWMNIAVGMGKGVYDAVDYGDDLTKPHLVTPPTFRWIQLDRSLMRPGDNAHDGHGSILFRRLWNPEAFATNWYVVSHAVVPPGSSIGYHQHNTREEVYYLIAGRGRLTANGRTFDVRAGDAVPCRLHGAHGIYNDSGDDLELLIFSCSLKKGIVTGERNLGDDLTSR